MLTPPAATDMALLACPRCGGSLQPAGPSLACDRCRGLFEVHDGVADLLPWSGGLPGAEWSRWREKLDRLQAWRRSTWDGSARADARQQVADDLASEFFKFVRVPESGSVLEIGCGGGDLRRFVPRRRYWGLDPLLGVPGAPLPSSDVSEAGPAGARPVFVRGVGERLPFADSGFETVLICETLDHALDPAQVLREARRVLKAGGLLGIMQSVRLAAPPPPLLVRLRAAAGRWRRMLSAPGGVSDGETKMRPMAQEDLTALVNAEFLVEAGVTRGAVMFLRALRQDLSSPRTPKRIV